MSTSEARHRAVKGHRASPQVRLLMFAKGVADEHGHCPMSDADYDSLGIVARNARARVMLPLIEDGWLLPCSFRRCMVLSPAVFQQAYRQARPSPFGPEHERWERG